MSTFRAASRLKHCGWAKAYTSCKREIERCLPLSFCPSSLHVKYTNEVLLHNQISTQTERMYSTNQSDAQSSKNNQTATSSSSSSKNVFTTNIDEIMRMTPEFDEPLQKIPLEEQIGNLHKWVNTVQQELRQGKTVNINKYIRNLSDIVAYAGDMTSSPELRTKCLVILLSQNADLFITKKLLSETLASAAQLPVEVISKVILILTKAAKTEFREEIRTKLVLSVVNFRSYQLSPTQVLFYMYQLDELFDMKKISAQNRLRNRSEMAGTVQGASHGSKADVAISSKGFQDAKAYLSQSNIVLSVNLESRIISLMEDVQTKDLVRALALMAKWRSRNEPLLKAMLHRLSQADFQTFSLDHLKSLLNACAGLKLYNSDFLSKITNQLSETSPSSVSDFCNILKPLSILNWRCPELIDLVLNKIGHQLDDVSPKHAETLITSLGNLCPQNINQDHAKSISDVYKLCEGECSPVDKVSCVHSLAILQLLTEDIAASVLNSEFVSQFKDSTKARDQTSLQKLYDINAVVKAELKDYAGPVLTDQDFTGMKKVYQNSPDKKLTFALMKTLGDSFSDSDTYTDNYHDLPAQLTVAAVICADSSGEVKPITVLNKDLTETIYRLALIPVPFMGVTSPDDIPVGKYQLSARLLKDMGYLPVHILYSDLRPSLSILEKVNKIKERIVSATQKAQSNQDPV